jgi:hypothetical protein
MSPRIRKITAIVSASALVGGAGLGAAQAATTAKDSTSTTRKAADVRRGPSSADLAKIAAALDVTTAQLQSAMDASRPAKPAAGTKPAKGDRGAGRAAAIATALGADVTKVQEILDANRPAKPAAGSKPSGARPAKPDQTKLVAALAEGLGLDTAKVQAALTAAEKAHRAEHDARHTEMYAAIAKALDKTTAQVQAAFEANRPAKRTR